MSRHISEQFDAELDGVRLVMMEMGGLVERQVETAVRSFVTHDAGLAEEVLTQEDEVNRLDVALDDQCVRTIALRQPKARDLRFLISIMKAGTDLERAGDEAARIAKMTNQLFRLAPSPDGYADLSRMGELVTIMVRGSLDAFARKSVEAAYRVIASDAEVDALYAKSEDNLYGLADADSDVSKRAICTVWVARSLERIGDHAKNIGEHLVYLIEGTDVRHAGSM